MAAPPDAQAAGAVASARPVTFWQYVVVYPTLALALGGAIPTVLREVKAWRLGVRSTQLELVQEQERL